MKITVLAVGRVKGPLAPAVREFRERAERYWSLEVVEVGEGGGSRPAAVLESEAEALLARIPDAAAVWALTRSGTGITSRGLASYLESLAVASASGVTFVLGGAHGLGDRILRKADRRLALSPMTLPHDLARLILLEQLYRAGTIRRNEPYHKGS